MKTRRLNQRGITLIEMLVACVIVGVLSIVIMGFLGTWTEQHAITATRTELLANAQTTLDTMGESIRLSSSADQNNRWQDTYAPSAPSNLLSWQSNANTLVLATAAQNTNGDIIFSDPANYTSQKNNTIYFVNAGNLYQRTLAAPITGNKAKTTCPKANSSTTCPADRLLASNVANFSVTYYNNDNQQVIPTNARSVELNLTLQVKKYNQTIKSSYKTRMVFRNR